MSITAMNWAWKLELPPSEKLILMAIADHADDHGVCFPSQDHIANKSCVSRRTVIRVLLKFEQIGLIVVTSRPGDGSGRKSNVYELQLDWQSDKLSQSGKVTNLQGQSDTSVTLTTNKPPVIKRNGDSEVFERFWKMCREHWYGPVGNKKEAAKRFYKINPDDYQKIKEAIIHQGSVKRESTGFVPNMKHVSGWLNNESWNDEIEVTHEKRIRDRKDNGTTFLENIGLIPKDASGFEGQQAVQPTSGNVWQHLDEPISGRELIEADTGGMDGWIGAVYGRPN